MYTKQILRIEIFISFLLILTYPHYVHIQYKNTWRNTWYPINAGRQKEKMIVG